MNVFLLLPEIHYCNVIHQSASLHKETISLHGLNSKQVQTHSHTRRLTVTNPTSDGTISRRVVA